MASLVLAVTMGYAAPARADSVDAMVAAIRVEAKQIDAANDAPPTVGRRQLSLELPHWELSGLFEEKAPIYLFARFSEDGLVREETYYARHGALILAKVARWWDVEDESQAPEPAVDQDFYIQNHRTIRQLVAIGHRRPKARPGDVAGSAAALDERSRKIAQVLLAGARDAEAVAPLADFPLAEPPQK